MFYKLNRVITFVSEALPRYVQRILRAHRPIVDVVIVLRARSARWHTRRGQAHPGQPVHRGRLPGRIAGWVSAGISREKSRIFLVVVPWHLLLDVESQAGEL